MSRDKIKSNDVCKFDASNDSVMFVQYSAAGYHRVKSSVFNLRLNTGTDEEDETKGGKLFQTRAAATGNARSPFVECFDRGMTSAAVFDDRSRRRESVSATRVSSIDRYGDTVPCWRQKASTARRYNILSELVTRKVVLLSYH